MERNENASQRPAARSRPTAPPSSARPAWVEIDDVQLQENFALIQSHKPAGVRLLSVVKDDAYGHGAVGVARAALAAGASMLGVTTVDEGAELRSAGITAPILLLGERSPDELPACLEQDLTLSVGDDHVLERLARLAQRRSRPVSIHFKVDTGMSRYGVRWDRAAAAIQTAASLPGIRVEGVMSHFAMSDETDKTFALRQLARFEEVLAGWPAAGGPMPLRHLCNTGGFLDLPQAWFDMVRLGILPLGVYPSQVCRRLPGLRPVMAVKARIVTVRMLEPGDSYGYGMRYQAATRRRIAVLPLGYGDGFPRLRNAGAVLVHGRRAPIVGGVSMDALAVDITEIPEAELGNTVTLMGRDGSEEITAGEIASWGNTVGYDVLCRWRARLPRVARKG